MKSKKSIVILYRDLCEEWIDLLDRAHFDTLGLHFIPDRFEMEGYLEWLEREGRPLIERVEAKGITVEHEMHALRYLLPRELFDTHPEYFRVGADGKRTPKHNCCTASDAAMEIVEERSYNLACALKQKSHRYYLWSDDTSKGWCHCEKCREISSSDQNLIFMERVLRGLRRYDPQAEVCYLAYHETLTPPTLPIPDGIFLEFAPFTKRDLFHPLAEEVNRPIREDIEALLRVFSPEKAEILEYWLDVSLFTDWGRSPLARVPYLPAVWEADFAYYTSLGIPTLKTFGAFMDRGYLRTFGDYEITEYGKSLKNYL